ncbi:hypothetical protein J3R30DRAFT_3425002, partial [Lentinula aciculospora]
MLLLPLYWTIDVLRALPIVVSMSNYLSITPQIVPPFARELYPCIPNQFRDYNVIIPRFRSCMILTEEQRRKGKRII